MELIDTHAHLYANAFDADRDAMMARALAAGVQKMYLPNIDSQSIVPMLALEAAYPAHCHAMMGLHPCSVDAAYKAELDAVEGYLASRDFVAIGEIGLDLYWDKTHFKAQQDAFRAQIRWAKAKDRPIVIHSRDSTAEVLAILEEEHDARLRGIFHCFGGSAEEAQRIIELGFLLGIGGVLTFKKSGLAETMTHIGMAHVVLETDSPYLAPAPHRGKRNESGYLPLVAQKLAEVQGLSMAEVAEQSTANAKRIFAEPWQG